MSIQWFPGHMNSAKKQAEEQMEFIDLVIEVLDARLPEASCNPLVDRMRQFRQRPVLKILNKIDLADPAATAAASAAWHAVGVLTLTAGTWGNVLRLLPPFVIGDDLLDDALDVLAEALLAAAGD